MRNPWLRAAFAVVSGLLWALCFREVPLSVASWAALAPTLLLLGDHRAGRLAFLSGLAFWLGSIWWIGPTLHTFGDLPWPVAVPLVVALAVYLALFHGVFGALGGRIWRRGGTVLPLLVLPALWVALEHARGFLLTGFPWNLAAHAWVSVAGALPLAAWVGVWGVSYLVVYANTGLALAVARRRFEPAAAALLVPLLLLPLGGRWAAVRRSHPEVVTRAALLQPDIPIRLRPTASEVRADFDRVLALSREACAPGVLVIWPESAAWPFVYQEDSGFREAVRRLTLRGCSVLFNSSHREGGRDFNSVYLVGAAGVIGRYDKRHLVPFGEYVPLSGLFSFMGQVARNAGAFTAGRSAGLLPYRGEQIGVAICFEITFPSEVASLVRKGATILVTVTNDAWYGDTAAPWQHLAAARFRAAENRRPILRAALTGVSAVLGPDGSVRQELGPFRRGILTARVAGRRDQAPFSRHPWLPPAVCWLGAAFGIFRTFRS